jgi:hypothetical protein
VIDVDWPAGVGAKDAEAPSPIAERHGYVCRRQVLRPLSKGRYVKLQQVREIAPEFAEEMEAMLNELHPEHGGRLRLEDMDRWLADWVLDRYATLRWTAQL